MKTRRFWAVLISIVMALAIAVMSVGCLSPKGDDEDSKGKLVIKVHNYNGGVGHSWLDAAKERFEEKNKDREFSNGLKGVFVDIFNDKNDPLNTIATSEYSVFFLETFKFNYQASQHIMLQIDDVVTGSNAYENKTIESKLSAETKSALKAFDGHYYVLPHYQSFDGVTYNKTVFDENNLYFAKNVSDYASTNQNDKGYGFIKDSSRTKSVGPNGIAGDYDDGLPSTVDELIRLCEYIKAKTLTPFIWYTNSGAATTYQQKLTNALWVSLEGYEGSMAQFSFDSGTTQSKIITGWNGDNYSTTSKTIKKNNQPWDIFQQESRYQALRFCQYLFNDRNNFHDSVMGSGSHTDIQKDFLKDDVAMILEGTYWRNEAEDAQTFVDYPALKNVETRVMPLPVKGTGIGPQAVTEGNGKAPTVIDTLSSYAFINANVKAKHGEEVTQMAKEFLQFCYTDESLSEFTVKSSVTKDVNYTLSTADYNKLSTFSRSTWDMKKNGKVVNPISDSVEFIKNTIFADMSNGAIWYSKGLGQDPCKAFAHTKTGDQLITAKQYFEGIKQARDEAWWNGLSR